MAIDNDPRAHNLKLGDRGREHRHRWAPECSCGWIGKFHRQVKFAEKAHAEHVQKATHSRYRKPGANRGGGWRPLTPIEDLPEILRPDYRPPVDVPPSAHSESVETTEERP